MATNFPTSVDNFTNPTANDSLNAPSHSVQHANANDAIEAIEGYLLTQPMGLRLVKTQTIGSGVSSVTVTNAFSATYDNYKIIISGGTAVAEGGLNLKLGSSASGYNFTLQYQTNFSAGAWGTSGAANNSIFGDAGRASVDFLSADIDLQNPFNSKYTSFRANHTGNFLVGFTFGVHKVASSYSEFTITSGSAMTGGTIAVYGYVKA